ncbi:hypothetical protein AAVH_17619 [Aphelenchoides avenae]|nr:hypothetical protein AAVH_34809 [Aphelenchus avenae]KAH7714976.1 hypothetical protein AAVH_17619 [Aphelenchus avenae]
METLEHMLWARGVRDVKFTTCFPAFVPTKLAGDYTGAGGWPVISASDCAVQVVQAIELERRFAFIPGREAWVFFFKGLLPWNLYSRLILCGFD